MPRTSKNGISFGHAVLIHAYVADDGGVPRVVDTPLPITADESSQFLVVQCSGLLICPVTVAVLVGVGS